MPVQAALTDRVSWETKDICRKPGDHKTLTVNIQHKIPRTEPSSAKSMTAIVNSGRFLDFQRLGLVGVSDRF
jgi:hypothetical protein